MCCLRYEHESYEAALKVTPTNGAYVSTPAGNGTVVESRPLAETVKVRLDDKPESPKLFSSSEITVLRNGKQRH
jgi:cell fate regulator YaaT (PSP1 superfamily)